jgi:CheY-specific phosphatase CheX
MLPEPVLDPEQLTTSATAAVSIPFRGPVNGRLVVAVAGDILPVMAANMLAENDLPSDHQQQDVLREIANVICGNLLPRIAGPKAVFKISAPEAISVGTLAGSCQQESPAAAVHIGLDLGRADVMLFLTSDAAHHTGQP